MSIAIDKDKCRACGRCEKVCPGTLISADESGKAYMKYPKDCWGCSSCIKECRFGAIALSELPPPNISDTKKYPRQGMKTIRLPEKIPLEVSGSITSKNVDEGLAPRSDDASRSEVSNFSIAVYKGSIINGIRQ